VEEVIRVEKPYKLASKEFKSSTTTVKIKDVVIGGKEVVVMAGPCVVENEKQIFETAQQVKAAGAKILRGGAFKPRTSPYSFQGLEEDGLKLLAQAGEETGLLVVTEVMSVNQIELVGKYTDIFQVGARNMQNFVLLKELGKIKKPILLKRGMSATLEELLLSAEYILSQGNYQVILCERGIRTFENYTRNTLDLSAVPALKLLSHLPVIVDPSHATGKWRLVSPMAKAAIAAGADGLLIEVHPDPKSSLSDGAQTLKIDTFTQLMKELRPIVQAVGRELGTPAEDDLERMKN
jgi:3-deoxy-7-phosphoheptulonate synthase